MFSICRNPIHRIFTNISTENALTLLFQPKYFQLSEQNNLFKKCNFAIAISHREESDSFAEAETVVTKINRPDSLAALLTRFFVLGIHVVVAV